MITRRDAIRLAALAVLAPPFLAACGDERSKGDGDVKDAGGLELVASDVARAPGSPGAVADVVAAMHRFAGGVYGALPADDNLVLSPYSIAVALGMTLTGAGGSTAAEMREVLGAGDRFHAGLNALTAQVEGLAGRRQRSDGSTAEIALDAANQLFGQRDVGWEQGFLDVLAEQYGAGMRTVDFATAHEDARVLINEWVEERTHARIEDLVPAGTLDELTRLVLVNAIYLKAPWEVPFDRQLTAPGPFHLTDGSTVEVDVMHSTGELSGLLRRGPGYQAATVPYAGRRLAMTIVLPDGADLSAVDGQVAEGGLPAMLEGGRASVLDLQLPKWTFRTSAALADVLTELGMPTAFDPEAADFHPMTREDLDLYVSAVLHQGFIAVDEEGTEAAAATAVVTRLSSAPVTQPFHVDRPFLFVIHDVEHGTPLFLGRVLDPSE